MLRDQGLILGIRLLVFGIKGLEFSGLWGLVFLGIGLVF